MSGERIVNSLHRLTETVTTLQATVKKDKLFDVWVDEKTAAAALGYCVRRFRSKVKSGLINIDFRCTNGRKYQYSRKGLIRFQNETSTAL